MALIFWNLNLLHHILITRFNLATGGREAGLRARPGWLEGRFDLFERICLPSVAAQDEQAFDWILYFDESTPGWARERLDALRPIRDFHACYTGLFDHHGWARTVRTLIGEPQPGRVLITSNLDNDDALARDYVSRVQAAARFHADKPRFAVNLPDGLVLADDALYAHRHLNNAFASLIEPDDANFATIKTIRHMELPDHAAIVQTEGPPAWIQLVHDGNVSNRIRGNRVGPALAQGRFPAEMLAGITQPSPVARALEGCVVAPLRKLRDIALVVFRRIVRAAPR